MKKNMVLRQLTAGGHDLLLFLHNARTPTRAEWDHAMAHVIEYARTGDVRRMRCLIITDGGGPDAVMRGELSDYYKQHQHWFKTAVISNSLVGRGIVAAISWFNPHIKVFSPRHFNDAFTHLELSPQAAPRILREAANLEPQVGSLVCLALINGLSSHAPL
jgi:hypothetical protein